MYVRVRTPRYTKVSKFRTLWAPSVLRRVLRHRTFWVAGLASLAAIGLLSLMGQLSAIDEERARWGRSATYVVVDHPVGRGESVQGSLVLRELPVALVPEGALREVPTEARALGPLHVGEVVVGERLTSSASPAMPTDSVTMTLPVVVQVPMVAEGGLVDLWTVDNATLSSTRVARHVTVVAFSDDSITVAVPAEQVAQATAASMRPVTVTVLAH